MKFKLKVFIVGILFSVGCMFIFHALFQSHTKNVYVCQVGIYALEENKDAKVSQLSASGYDAYTYTKNQQFYVLSLISDQLSEAQKQADQVGGIVKTYVVDENTSNEELLLQLEEGDIND